MTTVPIIPALNSAATTPKPRGFDEPVSDAEGCSESQTDVEGACHSLPGSLSLVAIEQEESKESRANCNLSPSALRK